MTQLSIIECFFAANLVKLLRGTVMQKRNMDFYVASGTGNTLLCAEKMADVFCRHGYSVDMKPLESGYKQTGAVLGIAMPVICFSAFPYVWKFIESLPKTTGKDVFLMATYGLSHHDVQSETGKTLKKKGYNLLGAKNIFMPHNLFDRNKNDDYFKPIIKQGLKEAQGFAKDIIDGKAEWKSGGLSSKIKPALSRTGFFWNLFRKKLSIYCDKSKCIKCLQCGGWCPVKNISYVNRYPEFKGKCEVCTRCVAFCPSHALDFKKKEANQYRAASSDMLDFLKRGRKC